MKLSSIIAGCAGASVALGQVHVSFDILRGRDFNSAQKRSFGKRDGGIVRANIEDEQVFYAANITISGAEYSVLLDTGSSDLWVYGSTNPFCSSNSGYSSSSGSGGSSKERLFGAPKQLIDERLHGVDLADFKERIEGITPDDLKERLHGVNPDDFKERLHDPSPEFIGKERLHDPSPEFIGKERLHGVSPEDFKERIFDTDPEFIGKERLLGIKPEDFDLTGSPTLEKRAFSTSVPRSQATIDCQSYGVFDTETQQWSTDDQLFLIQYGDLTYAIGYYGTSVVSFGNATLDGFTFAVANTSNSSVPVFGIGFEGNEASTSSFMKGYGGPFQYQNYPSALKQAGLIETNLYSMWMNSETAEGVTLFGGIDHSRYSGDLATIPLLNYYKDQGIAQPITFDVSLNNLSLSDGETDVSVLSDSQSCLLDSGTSFTYLPQSAVSNIADALGATYYSSIGYYVMNCPTSSSGVNFTFSFDSIDIQIPLEEFLVAVDSANQNCAVVTSGSSRCILGDTFLRSVYVVYDLDGLQVQMAPVNLDNSDDDVEIIGSAGPTESDGATRTTKLTMTVAGSVSAVDSQQVTSEAQGIQSSDGISDSTNSAQSGSSTRRSSAIVSSASSGSATSGSSATASSSAATTSSNMAGQISFLSLSGLATLVFMIL